MKKFKKFLNYFSAVEKTLWICSIAFILGAFFIFDRENYLAMTASLIGATAIIFCAKGNPFGQVLMIIFSTVYVYISFKFSYYGEVATYLFMTLPMSVIALISWLKNPYKNKRSEVKVSSVEKKDFLFIIIGAVAITIALYFILKYFGTANLLPSTVSVATSFVAVSLTYKRSPFFALAYAVNDVVLIVLWILATVNDFSYLSVVICFTVFLINDIYSFVNWKKMKKRQQKI